MLKTLLKKLFLKPKYRIGDLVRWNNMTFFVNDYYFDKEKNEMKYILFNYKYGIFYENIYENEIEGKN